MQQALIEQYVHWNEQLGEWQVKCVAYTGNNMAPRLHAPRAAAHVRMRGGDSDTESRGGGSEDRERERNRESLCYLWRIIWWSNLLPLA